MTKLAWGKALASLLGLFANTSTAKQVSGATSAATKATLFKNTQASYPNAQDSTQKA